MRNYVRHRVLNDDKAWERAYDLIVRLPKASAVDFIRLRARDNASILMPVRLRSFERKAASPREPPIRSVWRRLADIRNIGEAEKLTVRESGSDGRPRYTPAE